MAVASAGPYASLHLGSRQITMPATHHSVFLQARCPSCRPTNSVKALKAYQWFLRNRVEIKSVTKRGRKNKKNKNKNDTFLAFLASLQNGRDMVVCSSFDIYMFILSTTAR